MKRLLLFAALLAWSGMASAVVYKWVDAQGKVQYGDRPPDGVHAEVVELLVAHSAAARSAPASTQTASAAKPATTTVKDINDKNAIAQDVAQTRDKQCTEAQEHYKKLIEGRRMYKTGPNGERQFLSSEEIDTERLNAKQEVDNICNSTT